MKYDVTHILTSFDYNYKHLCTDDKNSDFNCELNNHISDFNILTNFRSDEIEDDENNGRNLKLDNDQEVEVNEIVTGNCITKGNDILNNNSTFFRERQSYEKASLYSDKEKTPRKNRSFLHFTEKEDGKTTSKTAESISRKTTQYEGKSSDETQSNDATAPCDISNRVPETVRVNIGKVNTDKFTILTFNFEGFMSSKLYFNLLTKRADIILLQEYWRHCRESKSIQENSENYICSIKSFDDDIIESPLERKRGHAGVAICYRKTLKNLVEVLPDGGKRVLAIRLNSKSPVVIICVYMPSRGGNTTLEDYKSVLDELSEITESIETLLVL